MFCASVAVCKAFLLDPYGLGATVSSTTTFSYALHIASIPSVYTLGQDCLLSLFLWYTRHSLSTLPFFLAFPVVGRVIGARLDFRLLSPACFPYSPSLASRVQCVFLPPSSSRFTLIHRPLAPRCCRPLLPSLSTPLSSLSSFAAHSSLSYRLQPSGSSSRLPSAGISCFSFRPTNGLHLSPPWGVRVRRKGSSSDYGSSSSPGKLLTVRGIPYKNSTV